MPLSFHDHPEEVVSQLEMFTDDDTVAACVQLRPALPRHVYLAQRLRSSCSPVSAEDRIDTMAPPDSAVAGRTRSDGGISGRVSGMFRRVFGSTPDSAAELETAYDSVHVPRARSREVPGSSGEDWREQSREEEEEEEEEQREVFNLNARLAAWEEEKDALADLRLGGENDNRASLVGCALRRPKMDAAQEPWWERVQSMAMVQKTRSGRWNEVWISGRNYAGCSLLRRSKRVVLAEEDAWDPALHCIRGLEVAPQIIVDRCLAPRYPKGQRQRRTYQDILGPRTTGCSMCRALAVHSADLHMRSKRNADLAIKRAVAEANSNNNNNNNKSVVPEIATM